MRFAEFDKKGANSREEQNTVEWGIANLKIKRESWGVNIVWLSVKCKRQNSSSKNDSLHLISQNLFQELNYAEKSDFLV